MSLTNPNKVVTEERLHEFYGEILPYLGGMPEALANKFSKSDLYSTDEKIIGCWTDGKPLYQKTFIGTITVNTETQINIGSLVEFGYVFSAMYKNSNGVCFTYPGTGSDLSNGFGVRICSNSNANYPNKILMLCAQAGTYYITIRYTKTTDSANSFKFGDENDYSADEKIIGTWVDGRYIYQKTDIINMDTNSTAEYKPEEIVDNLNSLLDIKFAGQRIGNTPADSKIMPLPSQNTSGSGSITYTCNNGRGYTEGAASNNMRIYTISNTYGKLVNVYITIQYTKTTD